MAETFKKLYRSSKNRMLFGICGGLAEYLNTDPTIIRVLAIVICVLSIGAGVIGYIALTLVVPEDKGDKLS